MIVPIVWQTSINVRKRKKISRTSGKYYEEYSGQNEIVEKNYYEQRINV